ncbi:MAG TPA: nucleotidyltransferase domain-containing protein [Anaerolineales bacterium]|nr:nucleotidyltransferase domain-containing protein [Anaerolineales bacterium]
MQNKPKTKSRSLDSVSINRQQALQAELDRWLPILVEHLKPEQILLFGSLMDKRLGEWSDIDLVIIQQTQLPFYQRIKQALKLIHPKVGVDLLIYTPEEFSRLSRERRFFRDEILDKGTVLYARG